MSEDNGHDMNGPATASSEQTPQRDPAALHYCRERALAPESAQALIFPFIPQHQQQAWLALQGLLADIVEIPEEVSEPLVGYSKLSWWREQLSQSLSQGGHPALRALRVSSRLEQFAPEVVTALLESLHQFLERSSYQTVDELWRACQELGAACVRLEILLFDGQAGEQLPASWVRARGLHYFLRQLHQGGQACSAWPFPLNLQARHQVNRQTFGRDEAASTALIADLLAEIAQQLPTQAELQRDADDAAILPTVLLYQVERRLLGRYQRRPRDLILRSPGRRWTPLDVLSLWWRAQSLRHLRTQETG